jgi:hypothetical protein
MPHYAEAFSVIPGHCFRFSHSGQGHACHCSHPATIHDRFVDRAGKTWTVDACIDHAEDVNPEVIIGGA